MRKFKYLLLSEIGFINVYELIIKKSQSADTWRLALELLYVVHYKCIC